MRLLRPISDEKRPLLWRQQQQQQKLVLRRFNRWRSDSISPLICTDKRFVSLLIELTRHPLDTADLW